MHFLVVVQNTAVLLKHLVLLVLFDDVIRPFEIGDSSRIVTWCLVVLALILSYSYLISPYVHENSNIRNILQILQVPYKTKQQYSAKNPNQSNNIMKHARYAANKSFQCRIRK